MAPSGGCIVWLQPSSKAVHFRVKFLRWSNLACAMFCPVCICLRELKLAANEKACVARQAGHRDCWTKLNPVAGCERTRSSPNFITWGGRGGNTLGREQWCECFAHTVCLVELPDQLPCNKRGWVNEVRDVCALTSAGVQLMLTVKWAEWIFYRICNLCEYG